MKSFIQWNVRTPKLDQTNLIQNPVSNTGEYQRQQRKVRESPQQNLNEIME